MLVFSPEKLSIQMGYIKNELIFTLPKFFVWQQKSLFLSVLPVGVEEQRLQLKNGIIQMRRVEVELSLHWPE